MSNFGGFNTNTSGGFGAGGAAASGTNTFGAAGSGGFGSNTAGTSGFGAQKTTAFGVNAGTGGFGATGATGFGTGSTSGTSAFGASSGGLGSTTPAGATGFGASNATGTGGFGTSGTGGFGSTNTGTGFGTSSTGGFGATSTGTSGFGTSGTGGFGSTNTGTGFGTSSAGSFGATNTGTGFGASGTGGFGSTNTGTGFGTSSAGGFGATNTGTGFGAGGFGATNTGGFGTSNTGGFGASSTASAFGAPASGATNTSAPSTGMFGGFGATAAKPTLGTGFNTTGFGTSGTTGFGANAGLGTQQAPAMFDASELKPWEMYDKISSLSEAEVKTFNLGKRQADPFFKASQDAPPPQPEKPTLEAPRTKGKLDCIQTFAMPNVDLISEYMAHGNHSVLTSGLYFSDEVTPINSKDLDLLETANDSDEDSSEPEFLSSSEAGFLTTPTLHQLSVMSEEELRHVEGFSISLPGIGRADFAHQVNLSALISDFQNNLQLIFKMRRGGFCIDPSQSPCPLMDTGLLGPASVVLYHLWLIDPVTGARIYSTSHPSYNSLLAPLKKIPGATFESLDIKKGHWKFIYKHSNSP